MSEIVDNTHQPLPEFSSADIVQVFGATFLPLCELLATSGIADYDQIARMISKHVPASESGGWAQLVRELVGVLDRATVKPEIPPEVDVTAENAPRRFPALTVLPGGRL